MAFQFSHEFHRNWLAAPKTERSRIKNDLKAIVELLKPDTELSIWQKQHGIYQKNTNKAEQVSLFDEDTSVNEQANVNQQTSAAQPATDTIMFDSTASHNSSAELPSNTLSSTSAFMQQVTQGIATQISQKAAQTLQKQSNSASGGSNMDMLLIELEHDIDNYLSQATATLKADIMDWLNHELHTRF